MKRARVRVSVFLFVEGLKNRIRKLDFGPMAMVRVIAAVILLAVWVPATWQCLLEKAAIVQADDCCPSSAPEKAPSKQFGSACCALAAGLFKLEDGQTIDIAPEEFVVRIPEREFSFARTEFSTLDFRAGKPWHLVQRAALPVRAPSSAS
jgi:hypothetical protein